MPSGGLSGVGVLLGEGPVAQKGPFQAAEGQSGGQKEPVNGGAVPVGVGKGRGKAFSGGAALQAELGASSEPKPLGITGSSFSLR